MVYAHSEYVVSRVEALLLLPTYVITLSFLKSGVATGRSATRWSRYSCQPPRLLEALPPTVLLVGSVVVAVDVVNHPNSTDHFVFFFVLGFAAGLV